MKPGTIRMPVTLKPRVAILDFQNDGCEPGAGRAVAERVTTEFTRSQRFHMIPRREWLRFAACEEPGQQRLFHPGWAAQMMTLAGADAIVLGRLTRVASDANWMRAMMLKASGEVLASGEGNNVNNVIRLLMASRLAVSYPARERTSIARIRVVQGSSLLLRMERSFTLRPMDWLRVDRILESVPDPYFQEEWKAWTLLTASIGDAEVMQVSEPFVVLQQPGNLPFYPGENLKLTKF